jgi:glutamine synthetase type III
MTNVPEPTKIIDMNTVRSSFEFPINQHPSYFQRMKRCFADGVPFVVLPAGLEYLCSLTSESEARPFDVIKDSDNVVSIGTFDTAAASKKREELRIAVQELKQAEQEEQTEENKQRAQYLRLKIMRLESECEANNKKDKSHRSYVGFSNEALVRNYMLNAILD